MDGDNLVLVVGAYADAVTAAQDFKALRAAQDSGEYEVVGAVVINRDASGNLDGDAHVAGGATLGGTAGLVVGLFAPPLLAATLIGVALGAGFGALRKRHEEKKMGVDLEQYLPLGSSAVVAVVDDQYADKVENALVNSDKRINQAIDSGDYQQLQQAIEKSQDEVRVQSPRRSRTKVGTEARPSRSA